MQNLDREFLLKELDRLREELHNLKECQISFLNRSVTATATLLGLAITLDSALSLPLHGAFYIIPLTVLLPSWWIFFDKATTITRIVGYYRVIEDTILALTPLKNFRGWENALARFREVQERRELASMVRPGKTKVNPIIGLLKLVFLRTTHRYWIYNYYIFFGLSLLSLILGFATRPPLTDLNGIIMFAGSLLVLISVVWNGRMVWQLVWGRSSYQANERNWEAILVEPPPRET